jgi:hypothetical protein
MKTILIHLLFLLCSGITVPTSHAAVINAVKTGSRIDITINGKFFTSYLFPDNEKYPFFFPLNGPASGGSVTSMRNAEYPHHSSLFFGCDLVNGGNYWQEGLDRGRIISINARIEKEGGDSVIISDECIWSRPDAFSPVRDFRRFIITSPSSDIYQIDIEITMEMLMDVHILKTNHSLFSARIASDLSVNNGGTMISAEGGKGEKETFGKNSAWIDYYGKRGTNIEGIAIIQHPSNPWYPSPWFTRDYGFMSPTPLYWPSNNVETFFEKGTLVRLRYRVLVHTGTSSDADIASQSRRYNSEKSDN